MGASESRNANNEQIKNWIDNEISSNLVVIFSKTYCPYCRKAKNAFKAAGLEKYIVHELDKRDDGEIIFDVLQNMTGARTVRILINLPSFHSEVRCFLFYDCSIKILD